MPSRRPSTTFPKAGGQDFLENFPLFSQAAPRRPPSEVKHFQVAVEGDAA